MGMGNELKDLVFKRTGIPEDKLVCPREKSEMTPCVVRDGDLAVLENGKCVGCLADVYSLLDKEKNLQESIKECNHDFTNSINGRCNWCGEHFQGD